MTEPFNLNPWDHNGECTYCDEQGMHRADFPWLLRLIAEVERLHAALGAKPPDP